jgi:hypothetical protein
MLEALMECGACPGRRIPAPIGIGINYGPAVLWNVDTATKSKYRSGRADRSGAGSVRSRLDPKNERLPAATVA